MHIQIQIHIQILIQIRIKIHIQSNIEYLLPPNPPKPHACIETTYTLPYYTRHLSYSAVRYFSKDFLQLFKVLLSQPKLNLKTTST